MCSSRRALGFLAGARASAGEWAQASLLDRQAHARGVDGWRASASDHFLFRDPSVPALPA
jgi:hypothetical protein